MGLVDVLGTCYHRWPCRYLRSVVCAAAGSHIGGGVGDTAGIILVSMTLVAPQSMLISLACDAAKIYDSVSGSCCGRGHSCGPWSVMPPETMLRSAPHTDAVDHLDVHGLCCHKKSRGSS